MTAALSDEPFVAYIFRSAPPHPQPRLWFLDRHLLLLLIWGPSGDGLLNPLLGKWDTDRHVTPNWALLARPGDEPPGPLSDVLDINEWLPGMMLRYESAAPADPWSAVWRLTDVTIPPDVRDAERGFGINTFGRDDDVWRLGVWPD